MATFNFNLRPNKWLIIASLTLGIFGITMWWLGPQPSWYASIALVTTNLATLPLLRDYRLRMHWYKQKLETNFSETLVNAMRVENPGLLRFPGARKPMASDELRKVVDEIRSTEPDMPEELKG